MPYTDEQQMIDRFGENELIQLTDRDNSAGVIVSAVLDRGIADADAEIDAQLARRYSALLPLDPVPSIVARIAADIARYHLYDDAAPEEIRNRYNDARKLLQSIADGKATLGLPEAPAGQGVGDVEVKAPASVFTRDNLQDF